MKDVIISIVGTQNPDAADRDSVELVTDGKYDYSPNGETKLYYSESELTGLEGTTTSFTVSPMGIVMSREGKTNTCMVFEQGKKHYFLYDTPFGSATMGVDTSRIRSSLDEHGGDMEIDYTVDFEHAVIGRNNFKIYIREARGGDAACQI